MSEDSVSDAGMLLYFWKEKRDVKRFGGYKAWAKENPVDAVELNILLNEVEWAEKRVTLFLEALDEESEVKPIWESQENECE